MKIAETAARCALIAAGGALGTGLRLLAGWVIPMPSGFPLPIIVVNVSGALLLGVVYGLTAARATRSAATRWRLFLGTGALGAYTTYGAFVVDADGLLRGDLFSLGALYVLPTVAIGILAAHIGERITAPRRIRACP